MENVKEKIKKLLVLGTSPNENEAKVAMLKAKELMVKYKLTEADVLDKKDAFDRHFTDISWTTDSGDIWMAELCELIASNLGCASSWFTRHGTRTHSLVLFGQQDDVDVAISSIKYAVDFIASTVKYLSRKNPNVSAKTVKNSYAQGFIAGLDIAYDIQKDEHPEWGLVVVEAEEVKDYRESCTSRSVRTSAPSINTTMYMRGQNDGLKFNTKRVLESC